MTLALSRPPSGGMVTWQRGILSVSSVCASAQPVNNIPIALSLVSIGGSTVSSLPLTNAPDGCSFGSSPNSTAVAASPTSHRSPAWTPTPSPEANANYNVANPSHPSAFANPVLVNHARKKKSARPEDSGRTASGRDGGRPHLRSFVDAPLAPQDPKGAASPRDSTDAAHDCPAVASAPLQPADQSQTAGRDSGSRPRSAVSLSDSNASSVHNSWPASH